MQSGIPCSRTRATGRKPSPRFASVSGQTQMRAPDCGEERELGLVGVRPVHDRRPWAEAAGLGEELDRPHSVLCQALLDLLRLLVRVDVEHEALALRIGADRREPVGRAGPDGVGGDADTGARVPQLLHLLEVGGDRGLPEACEAAARVGGEKKDELDSGRGSSFDGRLRLGKSDVVELADGRVARGPHLPVGVLVGRADPARVQLLGHLEHRLAPGPEVVSLRAAPHRALERMAVRRDESGQRMPVGHPREATIAPPCRDVQRSCGIPANRHVTLAAQVAKSRGRGVSVVSRNRRQHRQNPQWRGT